jgi:NADPH:quinone reductase-like Zn-dependent oxidoreductase
MIPERMKAAAIDRFGGPEVLHVETLPVPRPGPGQVLIRLDVAGVGVWDPYVREGGLQFAPPQFPQIIGNDGAGTVAAVGKEVRRARVGDRVYAYSMNGGFYAEYVVVGEDEVAPIPSGLEPDEAGALGCDGITALRGLEALKLRPSQKLLVFGASGGIGHIAVQLARKMGAKILAVASRRDGVELARRLGADVAVDGHDAKAAAEAARAFAPDGLDAALVLTSGEGLDALLARVKKGGRLAWPNGVEPAPRTPEQVEGSAYDGTPSRDAFERLNGLIGEGPFHVEIGRAYPLDEAARAHRELGEHHLGKVALRVH